VAKLKLNKTSLQQQRERLKLYKRLLPSLDLKRRQLTVELNKARREHDRLRGKVEELDRSVGTQLPMMAGTEIDLSGLVRMTRYHVSEENIVGVRLPRLDECEFEVAEYPLLGRPPWVDMFVRRLQAATEARVGARIAEQRVEILEQAVRRMTQRVNLFDKILIPGARRNIQRILIYLGDLERAAVSTAKLTKKLHLKRKAKALEVEAAP
jgi:V/A-type H+-transporting ATPase subunit D